jgi:CMP/dCMP kinase
VQLATLFYAQTAPIRFAERAAQVKQMLDSRILASRLAIWLMKDEAITIYLNASFETRMKNILKRENTKSKEEVFAFNKERDENDHVRFLKLYGIDNDEYSFADIIIETDNKEIKEIEDEIVDRVVKIMNMKKCPTIASTG